VKPEGRAELWSYALELYARPGVESLLLELQDAHGQCVAFLIWRLWLSWRQRSADTGALGRAAELAGAWEAVATAPLRRFRRGRRAMRTPSAAASERIRRAAKALEIESERMLLQMLQELDGVETGSSEDSLAALTEAAAIFGRAPHSLLCRLARLAA
jgi:uncharacterized protein (TIGR02444 family)